MCGLVVGSLDHYSDPQELVPEDQSNDPQTLSSSSVHDGVWVKEAGGGQTTWDTAT